MAGVVGTQPRRLRSCATDHWAICSLHGLRTRQGGNARLSQPRRDVSCAVATAPGGRHAAPPVPVPASSQGKLSAKAPFSQYSSLRGAQVAQGPAGPAVTRVMHAAASSSRPVL